MTSPFDRFSFVPATRAVAIGRGVVYRPLRSWHSGVFAGEESITDAIRPLTYTHRLYWNEKDPTLQASAFLSYPNGMRACDAYFWEAVISGDPERFATEEEVEASILDAIGDPP